MATTLTFTNTPMGYQTIIHNGRQAIVGDEPITSKGTDLGFSPPEFVIAGLGMCKAATVRFFARKNNWNIENVSIEMRQDVKMVDGKPKVSVRTIMHIEGNITEEQKQKLIAQANHCYVHRLIKDGEWTIDPIEWKDRPIDKEFKRS